MKYKDPRYCMLCGWSGEWSSLKDAMGYDVMCPKCGAFSEDLTSYIPTIAEKVRHKVCIKMGKKVLFHPKRYYIHQIKARVTAFVRGGK